MWIVLGRFITQNSPVPVPSPVRGPGERFKFFPRTVAVREKHIELVDTQRCVCVYIDMVLRDNTVQTAIMFSVTEVGISKEMWIQRAVF